MILVLVMSLITLLSITTVTAQPGETAQAGKQYLRALSDAFADAAEKVKPAVVSIVSVRKVQVGSQQLPPNFYEPFKDFWGEDFFDRFFRRRMPEGQPREYQQRGVGSGFIVDAKQGYILTANHVVEGADEINIMLSDKRSLTATVKGTDPKTDVAVLQIEADNLPEVHLGDSETLRVGEWVIAIGNPFELYYTVTAGIVSATGRSIGVTARRTQQRGYEDFIQTDAAINPGNSGGPLIDLEGNVIGINDAIVTRSGGYQGIGFAIPINLAGGIMDQLIEHGKVVRGWLGVMIQDLTHDLAKKFDVDVISGTLISQVMPNTPAEKAGLEEGDIITRVNGEKIDDADGLRNMIAMISPGEEITLTVIRDGKEKTIDVTIGEQPAEFAGVTEPQQPAAAAEHFGMQVSKITPELREQYNLEKGEGGVAVTGVTPNSPAAMAGIEDGNLILEVNRKKVTSLEKFQKLMKEAEEEGTVLLLVKTPRGSRFVILEK